MDVYTPVRVYAIAFLCFCNMITCTSLRLNLYKYFICTAIEDVFINIEISLPPQ